MPSSNGEIFCGDARDILPTLPSGTVQCCVTSPPYWGLRDYGMENQIGLEDRPSAYIAALMPIFDEIWRVLRDDGTLWLNLGDTYIGYHGNAMVHGAPSPSDKPGYSENMRATSVGADGLRNKSLAGIPWRVALALQARGWILRSDIIWHKPNPMPESVKDRPTRAHEYLFLLSKRGQYYYDSAAVREPVAAFGNGQWQGQQSLSFARPVQEPERPGKNMPNHRPERGVKHRTVREGVDTKGGGQGSGTMSFPLDSRNKRSVWTIPTRPFPEAHFATFPPDLIRPCILAGCPAGGSVLDPFFGSGTVGQVCVEEGRRFIGIEVNPDYVAMAETRIAAARPRGPRQVSFWETVEAMA